MAELNSKGAFPCFAMDSDQNIETGTHEYKDDMQTRVWDVTTP